MACVGAYECGVCGGMVFVGNAEVARHYGQDGDHVCDPKAVAAHRFESDPRLSLDDAVQEIPGSTYADVVL